MAEDNPPTKAEKFEIFLNGMNLYSRKKSSKLNKTGMRMARGLAMNGASESLKLRSGRG